MKTLLYILSMFSLSFCTIILVPEEYNTIQSGIEVAVDGDTVLVNQGIYYENLYLTKSITLASYAIFDNLENWTEYSTIFGEWQVSNENINNTIIDGSTATDDYGSCILIYSENDDCINPRVVGFTIQNGLGTQVVRNPGTDQEFQQRLGGGILFDISNPLIEYNQFLSNGSNDVFSGGAIYSTVTEEDWSFNNRDTDNRTRCDIDEFILTDNLYNGNNAIYGNTFANKYFEDTFNMSGSIFDIANCGVAEISIVWVYIEPEAELSLNDIETNLCAITASDVYVDSNIEQECIEDG